MPVDPVQFGYVDLRAHLCCYLLPVPCHVVDVSAEHNNTIYAMCIKKKQKNLSSTNDIITFTSCRATSPCAQPYKGVYRAVRKSRIHDRRDFCREP